MPQHLHEDALGLGASPPTELPYPPQASVFEAMQLKHRLMESPGVLALCKKGKRRGVFSRALSLSSPLNKLGGVRAGGREGSGNPATTRSSSEAVTPEAAAAPPLGSTAEALYPSHGRQQTGCGTRASPLINRCCLRPIKSFAAGEFCLHSDRLHFSHNSKGLNRSDPDLIAPLPTAWAQHSKEAKNHRGSFLVEKTALIGNHIRTHWIPLNTEK
ncbi:unnamed protein product [Pleuronectes platessa]|uniref:Uncharacterized protein n=1 Tax=Pleuronectes platessa TaxID=8262 RepID=A0A9N7YB39_PLEPL|nr:unnamed protein product [Pleuronectes platessa]